MNIASGAVNTWFDDASAFVIHTATGLSGSGLVERLRITSAGNVGINTTTFTANGTNFKVSDGTISDQHWIKLVLMLVIRMEMEQDSIFMM